MASDAGVRRPVAVDDPRVAADVLVHQDGRQFAWLVTHAPEPVTVKPQLSSGTRLCELDGTDAKAARISPRPAAPRPLHGPEPPPHPVPAS